MGKNTGNEHFIYYLAKTWETQAYEMLHPWGQKEGEGGLEFENDPKSTV